MQNNLADLGSLMRMTKKIFVASTLPSAILFAGVSSIGAIAAGLASPAIALAAD